MGGRKHSSEYPVRHAGCRAPSAGDRGMRAKCSPVSFGMLSGGLLCGAPSRVSVVRSPWPVFSWWPWTGSSARCFPWWFPWPGFPLGVFLPVVPPRSGSGRAGRVFAGRASFLRKWSRRVCFCRSCLAAPEVVAPEVPPAGWVWSLAGFGGWRRALVDEIGRSVDWSWPG